MKNQSNTVKRDSDKTAADQYKQTENIQGLLDQLRDHYITYKEYAQRGQTDHPKYYYFPPKIPLLEDPERQKIYRKKFLQDISQISEPEPLILNADILHLDALQTVADKSSPSVVRADLSVFFKRRQASLQHKKYKILNRWANQIMSSEYIDKTGIQLDSCLGRLQMELDITINRVERLSNDDSYNLAKNGPRPHPTAKETDEDHKPLYLESSVININSAIRQDDVEVYLRIQTYRNKLFRLSNKLVKDIKWLPYSSRYEIWGESRAMMIELKDKFNKEKHKMYNEVMKKIKAKLDHNGVTEERVSNAIIEKFTKHLKPKDYQSKQDQLMDSYKCNYEAPPIILCNNIEIKMTLIDLAKEFGITGDIEIDNGHSFTYQVQVFFPTHFQKQVLDLQFDWYDTSNEVDQDTIDKLTRNLGINKKQVVENLARLSELERKKSTLGRIKQDDSAIDRMRGETNPQNRQQYVEFFSLDETECKMKKADWLDCVCFEGQVPENIKRQSHYLNQVGNYDGLLESAFNFLDVNDGAAVNKILDESSQSHSQKAHKRNLLRSEHPRYATREDEIQSNLKNAVSKLDVLQDQIKSAEQPLLEQIPVHVVKAYYTLRYLKSRDQKIKLLHILNYFRSIQKRLSLDLREYCSRQRANCDLEFINPQLGKDQNGNNRNLQNGNNGPGGIFQNMVQRKLDDPEQDGTKHPISLKSFKYNQLFNPKISSTSPCLPRFHVTFGRPRLYEQISEQIDRNQFGLNAALEARNFTGRQDRIEINFSQQDVIIYDEYGIKVVYEEALNDMLEMEEELIKIGTFFINQHEFILDAEIKEPQSAIDRGEMTFHLLQMETQFQFEKVLLVHQFMECYEHIFDPLEQLRLAQIIADIMVQRPRLNLESTYFIDSYKNEIEILQQKRDFYREIIEQHIMMEESENEEIRNFQELKFRKIQEHMNQQWLYFENKQREERVGAQEDEVKKAPVTDQLKNRLEQKGIVEPDKRQRMREIAQRHITEYASNQYMDFQDVLGLPEVTAEQLYSKQGQKEPMITDCLREHSYFCKQMDGYPWFLSRKEERDNHQVMFGIGFRKIGMFDFYESLACVAKIEAAMRQSMEELINTHKPENGMALGCLEKALIFEARGKMKILRTITSDNKLMFLMREFKSHFNPEQIHQKANPLLIAKLDIDSVSKFNFPRLKQSDIMNNEELTQEQILAKMIDMAKITVVAQTQEEKLIGGNIHIEDFLEKKGQSQLPEVVKSPSMMVMSCNLIEVLRLREELIQRIHETDILAIIYKQQLKLVNKDSFRLILADSINFDTQSIIKDNLNMIDYNDGIKHEFDMPFREFDSSLRANLDFRSESCLKALMTDLGVEELRAVLHYQIMQQQILQIGILINQELMDGCQKGLAELDFLTRKKQFLVPNSNINYSKILSKSADGYNQELFNREKNKLRQILQREVADHIYSINAKKSKHRPYIIKRYSNVLAKVQTFSHKPETKLRILKSYRLKLLHGFCKDVLRESYQDSLKIQILSTAQKIRLRSFLLPADSNIFSMGLGDIYENIPHAFLNSAKNQTNIFKNHPKYNISLLLNNKFDTLFYIPSTDEIMSVESRVDEQKEIQLQSQAQFTDQISEQLIDQQIKDMVKMPVIVGGQFKLDDEVKSPLRKVVFNEAYQYTSICFKLLNYLVLLYRIFHLEYLMGRNNSPGLDVLEMEDSILSGRQYWEKEKLSLNSQNFDSNNQEEQGISDRVIAKIVNQRKARVDLGEDLSQISSRLKKMDEWPKKFMIENLKLENMIELLNKQHHQLYSKFLYGVEGLLEIYLDKKNDECFGKVWEIKELLIRKKSGMKIYSNGFNLSFATVHTLHQNLNHRVLDDNQEFLKVYQPLVNEENLMPKEIQMIKSFYSQDFLLENEYHNILVQRYMRDYASIDNCFLNMKDQERAYIYTNFFQIDESLTEFLQFKQLLSKHQTSDTILNILDNKIEFLNFKNEQKLLQNVLMTWLGSSDVPKEDTHAYEKMLKLYKDQMLLKILQERDNLNEQMQKAKERKLETKKGQTQAEQGIKVSKETLYEMFEQNLKEQHLNDKINERKAEINVIKRELEIRMIKQSIQMIKAEHSSLLVTFDQAATEKDINAFVHPQQQFAATPYQYVDRNQHLDVVNKLSFVQSFLTKLKNRCTEVETLTSGPGVVFSMKDFNECLQLFCRGLIKYGEQELRTRIETAAIRENQYRHLIYLKDQQNVYYRRKCELFLRDIDKLINAKLTQKGNQIIYELDISNRELRLLKDNFYMMERLMREEIRHEYERALQEKDNVINRFKESFQSYKSELNNEIKEEVAKEILSLDKKVKQIAKKESLGASMNNISSQRGYNKKVSNATFSEQKQLSNQASNPHIGQNQGYYDAEQIKEINSLQRYIRKHKILTKMKEVLMQEKHERELFHQRQKLTSNECLWDQLAEAEKREQIVRQELYYTQQSLASYEKLIEKLQIQLETIQSQKMRLQQYKNSKSKRIEELESKMREIEILENIDLNKVLEELRQRDKKLNLLEQADRNFSQKLQTMNKINERKINEIHKKYQQEKDLKSQAYSKMDNMRLEMKALEGRDFANDLWKEKCKELFEICKELQKENEDLKLMMNNQQQQMLLLSQQQQTSSFGKAVQGASLPVMPFSPTSNQDKPIFSLNSGDQTTKPQSATTKFGGTRLMSRGNQGIGLSGMGQVFSQPGEQTLTSGLSLPDIMGQENDGQTNSGQKTDFRTNQFATQTNFGKSKKSRENTLRQNLQSETNTQGFITTGTITNHPKISMSNFQAKGQYLDQLNSGAGMYILPDQQMTTMTSGDLSQGLRNIGGQFTGSHQSIAKSQTRGTALMNQQKMNKKRLKTSQGGRRNEQGSQTVTGPVVQYQQYQEQTPARKNQGNMSKQLQKNITAGIIAGHQIAQGSSLLQTQGTNIFRDTQAAINLNINFNTTNINLKK